MTKITVTLDPDIAVMLATILAVFQDWNEDNPENSKLIAGMVADVVKQSVISALAEQLPNHEFEDMKARML